MSIIVIVLLVLSSNFGYVHANESACPSCNSTPGELQTYFRVMDQLIALLPTTRESEPEGILSGTSQASILGLNLVGTTATLSFVLTAQTFTDMFAELKTLYRSESLRRDRYKMVDYDFKITQRVLDMVKGQRHNDVLTTEELQDVDRVLQQLGYVKLKKDTQGNYELKKLGATYTDIAEILWKLHNFYKRLHQKNYYRNYLQEIGSEYWMTDDEDNEKAIEKPENEDLTRFIHAIANLQRRTLRFCRYQTIKTEEGECIPQPILDFAIDSDEKDMKQLLAHVWQIQDAYECSTGLGRSQCGVLGEIEDRAEELYEDRIQGDVKSSIHTFLDAWSRLKSVLFGPNKEDEVAFNQRKDQLVDGYWGSDNQRGEGEGRIRGESDIDPVPQTVASLWKTIQNGIDRNENSITAERSDDLPAGQDPTTDPLPEGRTDPDNYAGEDQKLEKLDEQIEAAWLSDTDRLTYELFTQDTPSQYGELTNKVAMFQNRMRKNLLLQSQLEKEHVYIDVNRVTHQFPALSAAVYKNMEIIGKKNDDGKLYHAVGNVCELQCTNLGGTCWWYN